MGFGFSLEAGDPRNVSWRSVLTKFTSNSARALCSSYWYLNPVALGLSFIPTTQTQKVGISSTGVGHSLFKVSQRIGSTMTESRETLGSRAEG